LQGNCLVLSRALVILKALRSGFFSQEVNVSVFQYTVQRSGIIGLQGKVDFSCSAYGSMKRHRWLGRGRRHEFRVRFNEAPSLVRMGGVKSSACGSMKRIVGSDVGGVMSSAWGTMKRHRWLGWGRHHEFRMRFNNEASSVKGCLAVSSLWCFARRIYC